MPSFEETADTGMFWNAKEEVVVEPEDKTELEDDANVSHWGAIFDPSPFGECLYSDMS